MRATGSRQRLTWDRVSVHDSIESGRAALALYNDGTKNPSCNWKRAPGGDAQRIVFDCSMHLDCGAKVRLVATPSGSAALEKLSDVEHSDQINEYDRVDGAKRLFCTPLCEFLCVLLRILHHYLHIQMHVGVCTLSA